MIQSTNPPRTRRSVIGFSAVPEGAHGGGHFGDDAISDHEVESFCLSISALQKLMASEQVRSKFNERGCN